jgi:MerR family Zn(II)-responsive transcriptional regulator of zntA
MKRLSDIAKKHNVLPSQIRYYIKFGLIIPSNKTQGGFYLFNEEDEKIVDMIFDLKEKGLELNQIKEKIAGVITSE